MCCFVSHNLVFVSLFYNYQLTHYHFIWNIQNHKCEMPPTKIKLDCSKKNFPYKCFYNDEDQMIYTFYRQGQYINVNLKTPSKYDLDRMTDMDLGQMYLVYN